MGATHADGGVHRPIAPERGLEAIGSKVPGGSSLKAIGELAPTVFVDGNLVREQER